MYRVDPNKHSMSEGSNGHNGVIRYYQNQITGNKDGLDLAEKIEKYLSRNNYSKITSNVKTIDLN